MDSNKLEGIIEGIFLLKPVLFKNIVNPVLTGASITPGSHYVLHALLKSGELSMTNLSRKISIPKPNLTAIIDRMIEQELVERRHDESDRRIVKVALTESGLRKTEEIKEGIKNNIRNKLSFLAEQEIDELSGALDKLHELFNKMENKQ